MGLRISKVIRKYLEMNENKNTTKNLWNAKQGDA